MGFCIFEEQSYSLLTKELKRCKRTVRGNGRADAGCGGDVLASHSGFEFRVSGFGIGHAPSHLMLTEFLIARCTGHNSGPSAD